MPKIVMVRHGRSDLGDEALLAKANPHVREDWLEVNIPRVAKTLMGIKFDAVLHGPRHRMTDTLHGNGTLPGLDTFLNFHRAVGGTIVSMPGILGLPIPVGYCRYILTMGFQNLW